MKLIILVSTCAVLTIGWIIDSRTIAIAGLVIFFIGVIIGIVDIYRSSRSYKQGRDEEWNEEQTKQQKVTDGLWNWLPFAGLILAGVGGIYNNEAMAVSGIMLYVARIVAYIVAGIIVQFIAGIPLRMTYGG